MFQYHAHLFNHWFYTDHKSRFKYHGFQQEAIEILIYLYEVEKLRSQKALLQNFCTREDCVCCNTTTSRESLRARRPRSIDKNLNARDDFDV